MDIKAKIPQKMNKIARIFVRDIRGIDFINLEITLDQFSTFLHEIFGIDSKSHFDLIVGSRILI